MPYFWGYLCIILIFFIKFKNHYANIGCGSRIWTYDLQVMSLTSYLAAPSRGVCFWVIDLERIWVLIRFGGALLSHTLRCSTIGATALNFRVREGTGCFACALATKPNKNPKLNSRSEFRRWPEAICRRQIAWPHLSYVTEHVCSASFQYHQRVDPLRRVNELSKLV